MNVRMLFGVMLVITGASLGTAQQIDYATQVQPIFNANCVGCHGGTNNLFLESYATVMAGTSLHGPVIKPGNGAGSILIQKLEGTASFGSRMPFGGPFLVENQIQLIRTWIDEGAKAVPTDVESESTRPVGFTLHQNFPNPFNPTTTIQILNPKSQMLNLRVFDMLGREVAVLVNERKPAGTHTVTFDASGLSSGIFFYTLKAGASFQTKKMIMLE